MRLLNATVAGALIAAYATAQASNIEEVRVMGRNSTISYAQTLGDFCRANSSNPQYADLCVYVSTGTGVYGPGEQNYAGNPDCGNGIANPTCVCSGSQVKTYNADTFEFECVAQSVVQSECIIGSLEEDDRAEATPHELRIEENPRVGGENVDSFAGCIRGNRFVTVVKRTVAEGSVSWSMRSRTTLSRI